MTHTPLLSSVNQNKITSGENNIGGSPDDSVINRNNDTSGKINLFGSPGDSGIIHHNNTSGENNMIGSPGDSIRNRNNIGSGENNIFGSPGDSVTSTLRCAPVNENTTDEIFLSINDDNIEEDEESDVDEDEEVEEIHHSTQDSNGWKICDTKYHNIKVTLNSADMDMKVELKKGVKYLLSQLETKKAGMHFSSQIPPCAESMNLAAYANEALFQLYYN